MALNKATLKNMIISELQSCDFLSELAIQQQYYDKFAQAIANAVVDHINQSAEVPVTAGSSSGVYQVK